MINLKPVKSRQFLKENIDSVIHLIIIIMEMKKKYFRGNNCHIYSNLLQFSLKIRKRNQIESV